MTQTAEKTDVQLAEEWHNMQMNAKANGNKIYRVTVQQEFNFRIYQASFLEDGFRNKTEVKDFYMGDSHNGRQKRHFGNEELFKRISCFASELVELQDCAEYHYEMVSPARRVDTTVYPTESSKDYSSPDAIPRHKRTYDHIVHPDWTCVGKTYTSPTKNNNIKLISITEWK